MYTFNRQLVLEDGTVYRGYGFGSMRDVSGEVVFNTAMTGYQEALSDPSSYGQIVTFTYPLIGNSGINRDDYETINPSISGLVVRELCEKPSNFRTEFTLDEVLKELDIPGIAGIDTRALTRKIRDCGTLKGIITNSDVDVTTVLEQLRQYKLPVDQVAQVSTKTPYISSGRGCRVVLIDCGVKSSIIRELNARDCDIIVMPYNTTAKEVLRQKPDGVLISSGPGNPVDVPETIETIKTLLPQVPMFGIGLGHQLIALAGGAKTYPLPFGHHGANQPVKVLATGKVVITAQGHGYAVDNDSLADTALELTHVAINDGTCEGLKHREYPVFSVQFQPEGSGGPHDASTLFDDFIANMTANR